jgi:L-fucose dehydrogenase
MDLQLSGKVVLITGGAKGIGAAIARSCVREGATPVLVDKDNEAGKQLQTELQKSGASCGLFCTDLLPPANCVAAIDSTLRDFKRLDVLVNNAGINDNAGLEHGSPEKFLRSLQLNLHHYYNMAHYALPALKRSQGCIINIASKVAVTGQGGTSGYAAAKGAILSLTREWAAELLPYRIRVNALLPRK